jgi:serine/threonine protein kinase
MFPHVTPNLTSSAARLPRLPSSTRYELLQPLGTGTMGTVYRALDRRTDQPVAVKMLKSKRSESSALYKRLAQELPALVGLDHPNIARPLAFEEDGDCGCLVYELVEGGRSLLATVEQHGRLAEEVAVRIITQLAQALHYAHGRQVVHRDVNPANVLLLPDGRAKLTDFGLAKEVKEVKDAKEVRSGSRDRTRDTARPTPAPAPSPAPSPFMAPELVVKTGAADARCDVYSLAATLYHAIAGRPPVDPASRSASGSRRTTYRRPTPTVLVAGLSGKADAAIRAALEPNPDRRPATCMEFFRLLSARRSTTAPVPKLTSEFPGAERRASVRFGLKVGGCAVVDPDVHGGWGSEEAWPLVVRDVSSGGVGVLLARRFEPGTDLSIELVVGTGGPPQRLPARVVRVQAERGGYWVHGCAFDPPLSDEQLATLLKFA